VTSPPSARRIDELSGIDALLNPTVDPTEDYTPRRPVSSKLDDLATKPIADRHLANFFETIHTLLPVLHEGAFRALYDAFWMRVANEPASHAESNIRKITAPLVYSVLALGALYEDGYSDNAVWAKEWFAKARDCVNNAVEECCFEMCLGVYFLVIYRLPMFSDLAVIVFSACHQTKPGVQFSWSGHPASILHWLK
jgi:hypothetical protein